MSIPSSSDKHDPIWGRHHTRANNPQTYSRKRSQKVRSQEGSPTVQEVFNKLQQRSLEREAKKAKTSEREGSDEDLKKTLPITALDLKVSELIIQDTNDEKPHEKNDKMEEDSCFTFLEDEQDPLLQPWLASDYVVEESEIDREEYAELKEKELNQESTDLTQAEQQETTDKSEKDLVREESETLEEDTFSEKDKIETKEAQKELTVTGEVEHLIDFEDKKTRITELPPEHRKLISYGKGEVLNIVRLRTRDMDFHTIKSKDPEYVAYTQGVLDTGISSRFEMRRVNDTLGAGLFLKPDQREIPKGTLLFVYPGEYELVPENELHLNQEYAYDIKTLNLTKRERTKLNLPKEVKKLTLRVNALNGGNCAARINHSSEFPNVDAQPIKIGGFINIGIFAREPILPGQQILSNYTDRYWETRGIKPEPIHPNTYSLSYVPRPSFSPQGLSSLLSATVRPLTSAETNTGQVEEEVKKKKKTPRQSSNRSSRQRSTKERTRRSKPKEGPAISAREMRAAAKTLSDMAKEESEELTSKQLNLKAPTSQYDDRTSYPEPTQQQNYRQTSPYDVPQSQQAYRQPSPYNVPPQPQQAHWQPSPYEIAPTQVNYNSDASWFVQSQQFPTNPYFQDAPSVQSQPLQVNPYFVNRDKPQPRPRVRRRKEAAAPTLKRGAPQSTYDEGFEFLRTRPYAFCDNSRGYLDFYLKRTAYVAPTGEYILKDFGHSERSDELNREIAVFQHSVRTTGTYLGLSAVKNETRGRLELMLPFYAAPIPKNTLIGIYAGEYRVIKAEDRRRKDGCYDIDEHGEGPDKIILQIDPSIRGNYTSLIKHSSKNPNVAPRLFKLDDGSLVIGIIATEDIQPNSKILIDREAFGERF